MDKRNHWDLDKLKQMVKIYCLGFRNPKLGLLEVSDVFELDNDWKEPWPNAESAGVYAIFGESGLLYIGKASLNSSVGARLASYFKKGDRENIVLNEDHDWTKPGPTYFVTIATEFSWEAPALEEFLILEAKPIDNSIGI